YPAPQGPRKKAPGRGLVSGLFLACIVASYLVIAGILPANSAIPIHRFARVSVTKFSPAIRIKFIRVSDLAVNENKADIVGAGILGDHDRINIDDRGCA